MPSLLAHTPRLRHDGDHAAPVPAASSVSGAASNHTAVPRWEHNPSGHRSPGTWRTSYITGLHEASTTPGKLSRSERFTEPRLGEELSSCVTFPARRRAVFFLLHSYPPTLLSLLLFPRREWCYRWPCVEKCSMIKVDKLRQGMAASLGGRGSQSTRMANPGGPPSPRGSGLQRNFARLLHVLGALGEAVWWTRGEVSVALGL